jgi:hypothetical protein
MTTHFNISLLLDESGSMYSRHAWVIKAYNDFFNQQKLLVIEGETCTVSTYFFNDQVRTIQDKVPITDVSLLTESEYRPTNGTALYDAMIDVLDKMHNFEGRKLFVVITDGMNNSGSKTATDLQEKIESMAVEIVYMGSNQDAILHGAQVGARQDATLEYDDNHFLEAMDSMGNAVSRMRSGETQAIEFTELERSVSGGGGGGGGGPSVMPIRRPRFMQTLSPLPDEWEPSLVDVSSPGGDSTMLQLPPLLPPLRRYESRLRGRVMVGSSLDSDSSDTDTVVL